jgi:hypothetical protein
LVGLLMVASVSAVLLIGGLSFFECRREYMAEEG